MPSGCWSTPRGRCAGPRPGPRPGPPRCALAANMTRRRGGGAAGWCARSTTWPSWWRRPARSPRRPGNGCPDRIPDGATRRVSLHDGDARPIAKGRLGKPVEFGHKAQVTDNDDGVIVDHTVEMGNPPDAPQLAPAVGRVKKRAGRAPGTVTADRGYGEKRVEDDLHDLGVRTVVISRKGKPGQARRAEEHRPAFRRTIKWRTEVKAASASSSVATAGIAPASTAPKEPESGPGTASSPTTWSRSAPSPRDRVRPSHIHAPTWARPSTAAQYRRGFFRSK